MTEANTLDKVVEFLKDFGGKKSTLKITSVDKGIGTLVEGVLVREVTVRVTDGKTEYPLTVSETAEGGFAAFSRKEMYTLGLISGNGRTLTRRHGMLGYDTLKKFLKTYPKG